ncbi:H-NS family histone-like protein [Aeromonas veronii]|uniref:H-NS family histone-like protein n=1 Tax=Aeromonas veronii TaxID=654 RepID=UPI0029370423|nr:H-NS family nucleoid-associated regulatory protein [Aeromonas veronii]WOE87227.1 H-NS family nucleoid-associated regulatory protein [Aeromonas veronii]
MNDFLKVLLNIRSLRAAVRDLPFDQLQEIKEKFDTVIQELLKAAEAGQKAKLEHEKKLAEFRELLVAEGISAEDLLGRAAVGTASTTSRVKRPPRPAKYAYIVDGEERTWTGQGRMPAQIAAAVENGKLLEDFLIAPATA